MFEDDKNGRPGYVARNSGLFIWINGKYFLPLYIPFIILIVLD